MTISTEQRFELLKEATKNATLFAQDKDQYKEEVREMFNFMVSLIDSPEQERSD